MMNLNEFAKEVHDNSVRHGWWEDKRELPEICALIHSEWSEALEEARAGRGMVWCGENGKPEGIAVELIDGCIRILDWLGHEKHSIFPPMLDDCYSLLTERRVEKVKRYTLPELIASLHYFTSEAYYDNDSDALLSALLIACYWLKQHGVDPEIVMIKKHEYNKSRPYKHGKKF